MTPIQQSMFSVERMRPDAQLAIVLGAGFSACASLPTQDAISASLATFQDNQTLDHVINKAIHEFLTGVFRWNVGDQTPSLEDVFTMIDLSANTGHNLGRNYTPKKLRALRRIMIYRVFAILNASFTQSDTISELIRRRVFRDELVRASFVVLNWDIALESHLQKAMRSPTINYGIDATLWSDEVNDGHASVRIAKVHGSSNWVYCDNCRTLYFDVSRKLSLALKAGLVKADFRLFVDGLTEAAFSDLVPTADEPPECPACKCALGPHVATFSFKKSFRTHAFAQSWMAAEQILSNASEWLFVGYSLPDADYEFKHLLKVAQLKFARENTAPKAITVVLKNDESAEAKFRRFFGAHDVRVLQGGLEGYVAQM